MIDSFDFSPDMVSPETTMTKSVDGCCSKAAIAKVKLKFKIKTKRCNRPGNNMR